MQADSIKIESDEDGFELHVETDEGDRFAFNIHSCAEALHEQVNLIIGGWLAEGRAARAEYDRAEYAHERQTGQHAFECAPEDIDESGGVSAHLAESRAEEQWKEDKHGYALDDPHHPAFHSVHADHYDNREKV